MNFFDIDDREITFTHRSTYWPPNTIITEEEIKWNDFLRNQALPYLVNLCKGCGINTHIGSTKTKVDRANIRFEGHNILGHSHMINTLETTQNILDFSSDILGEYRIMMN